MLLVSSLVPQQIAVGTGVKELLIALLFKLSQRKRDRAVRMSFLYGADDGNYEFICIIRVLSSLQNKSAESQIVARVAACQDLLLGEAVAFCIGIAASYAAIQAIIFTDV